MKNPTTSNPAKTDTLLFEHFSTLATAPDGIARLRELILQLAVQGKLGTQDAGDEPASVLLEKIKKERNHFEKTRGITLRKTKEANYSKYEVNNVPLKWECKRLEELSLLITKGATPTSYGFQFLDEGINFVKVENVRNGQIDKKSIKNFISPEAHKNQSRSILQKGDLLFSIAGSIGTASCFVRDEDLPANVNQALAIVRGTTTVFNPLYLLLFLRSSIALDQVLCRSRGGAMNNVSLDDVRNILVNVPPLAEQHRIVEKVDRLMALCDELEVRQQQERAGCLKLGTASLTGLQNAMSPEEFERQWVQVCDAFDLIMGCPENVAALRQTILQLAVQGRLVKQEPGDESARALLETIRREKERLVREGKIGKTKITPEIETEEILYAIPKNWIWTRLDHITYISTGSTPSTSIREYYLNGNIHWVTSSLTSQNFIFDSDTKITEKAVKDCSLKVYPKGTLLVALYGQGKTRGQVSELGIPATINQACSAIVFWKNNEPVKDYLKLVLAGNYEKIRSISAGGAQPNLNGDKIKRTLIPLPPLAEQHRIVAKVDALMALCDALESRLKERAGVQGRLAGAVVKQVAG